MGCSRWSFLPGPEMRNFMRFLELEGAQHMTEPLSLLGQSSTQMLTVELQVSLVNFLLSCEVTKSEGFQPQVCGLCHSSAGAFLVLCSLAFC